MRVAPLSLSSYCAMPSVMTGPWADGIDQNAVLTPFQRQRAGQVDDGGARRCGMGEPLHGIDMGKDDVDDARRGRRLAMRLGQRRPTSATCPGR